MISSFLGKISKVVFIYTMKEYLKIGVDMLLLNKNNNSKGKGYLNLKTDNLGGEKGKLRNRKGSFKKSKIYYKNF